jgi:predicted MPP superfamily phosphohydrolase
LITPFGKSAHMFREMANDLSLQDKDVIVVHSSDLHMDHDYTARLHGGDGTAGLAAVLTAAQRLRADVVVLAGDTFDCHRLPIELLDRVAGLISSAAVLLPGNHDPLVAGSVYHHEGLARAANLHVLGLTSDEGVLFTDLSLEIWGRPHRDYADIDTPRTTKAAVCAMANRARARPLCGSSRSIQPIASLLAHWGRRACGNRRGLHCARPLEPAGKSRPRGCLLFRFT